MHKFAVMLGFSLVFACGGSDGGGAEEPMPPKAEPTGAAEPAAQPSSMLEVGDMTVVVEGTEAVRVKATGDVEVNLDGSGNWQNAGAIADDAWGKDGQALVKVTADGNVDFKVGGSAPALEFDGTTLVAGDNRLAIGDDGVMTGLKPGSEGKIKVIGATTDAQKRTALLVTIAIFMVGQSQSEASAPPPSGSEPQPAPGE